MTIEDPETRYRFNIEGFGTHPSQAVFGISECIVTCRDFRRKQIFQF
jgi:hypothetical protein